MLFTIGIHNPLTRIYKFKVDNHHQNYGITQRILMLGNYKILNGHGHIKTKQLTTNMFESTN